MAKSKYNRNNFDYDDDDEGLDSRSVSKQERRNMKRLNNLIRAGSIDTEALEELQEEL